MSTLLDTFGYVMAQVPPGLIDFVIFVIIAVLFVVIWEGFKFLVGKVITLWKRGKSARRSKTVQS